MNYADIKKKITSKVVGQDRVVDQCLLFLIKHLFASTTSDIPVNDILLLTGETGTGKTFTIQTIADNFNIELLEINSKSISQEGWSGTPLKEHLTKWGKEVIDPNNLPELIVIFMDEFDKICIPQGSSNTENHAAHIQNSLLKYFEFNFKDIKELSSIPKSKFCFILAGNFEVLRQNRIDTSIGFTQESTAIKTEVYEELINFGMIPEIAGRITHVVELEFLDKKTYNTLWEDETFIVKKWKNHLSKIGINVNFSKYKSKCVSTTVKKRLGVRGLIQEFNIILNKLLLPNADSVLNSLDKIKEEPELTIRITEEKTIHIGALVDYLILEFHPDDECYIDEINKTVRFPERK